MPFGNVPLWFKTEPDAFNEQNFDFTPFFELFAKAVHPMYIQNKIVVYKLPSSLTEEELKTNLLTRNIDTEKIVLLKSLNSKTDLKTAFCHLIAHNKKTVC